MQTRRQAIDLRRTIIAAAWATASTLGVAGCGFGEDGSSERSSGTVSEVPSADSVTLLVDGTERTFALAYLEAPKSGTEPTSSCLARQSAANLRRALPADKEVSYEERRSGVLLYDVDGRLINADPITAGLAIVPVEFDDSPDVPAPILAALEQARVDRVGLHGTTETCTAPSVLGRAGIDTPCVAAGGQVSASPSGSTAATATTTVVTSAVTTGISTAVDDLQTELATADARWDELAALSTWIHDNRASIVWRALSSAERTACQDRVNHELDTVLHQRAAVARELDDAQAQAAQAARLAEEQRLAAEAEAARVAEEQRLAAEAEAARVAEVQRKAAEAAEAARIAEEQRIAAEEETEAARAAAEAEANRSAQSNESQSRSGSGGAGNSDNGGSNSNSNGGYTGNLPGYNGPRCYAPGGQTWRPC